MPASESTGGSAAGKRYLETVLVYNCARDYVGYEVGGAELPPVQAGRTETLAQREQELTECAQRVAKEKTQPEVVKTLTWNGSSHDLSAAEIQGVAQFGGDYVSEVLSRLIESERRRESMPPTPVARSEEDSPTPP